MCYLLISVLWSELLVLCYSMLNEAKDAPTRSYIREGAFRNARMNCALKLRSESPIDLQHRHGLDSTIWRSDEKDHSKFDGEKKTCTPARHGIARQFKKASSHAVRRRRKAKERRFADLLLGSQQDSSSHQEAIVTTASQLHQEDNAVFLEQHHRSVWLIRQNIAKNQPKSNQERPHKHTQKRKSHQYLAATRIGAKGTTWPRIDLERVCRLRGRRPWTRVAAQARALAQLPETLPVL